MSKNGYRVVQKTGRVRAAQSDYLFVPTGGANPAKRGVVLLHGAGTPMEYLGGQLAIATAWASSEIPLWLAQNNIPSVGAVMSSDAMSSDAGMLDITNAITLLGQSGCAVDKVHLLGVSMGGGMALSYAALNPNKVASIGGIIPLTDLLIAYLYKTVLGQFDTIIASAWGVAAPRVVADAATTLNSTTITSATAAFVAGDVGKWVVSPNLPFKTKIVSITNGTTVVLDKQATATSAGQALRILTALPARADFVTNVLPPIAAAGIPFKTWYSTVDTTLAPADIIANTALGGGTSLAVDSTYGHAEGTVKRFIDNVDADGRMKHYTDWIKGLGA